MAVPHPQQTEAPGARSTLREELGLSEDELAFYDALEVNDSAVKVLGEPTLKTIARELVESVRKNVTIDWTVRDNVRALLRVIVKRILRKHGYPPDKQRDRPFARQQFRLLQNCLRCLLLPLMSVVS